MFKHYKSVEAEAGVTGGPASPQQFVQMIFTQRNRFDELVNAAEGVPRDAINVLALAAQRCGLRCNISSARRQWAARSADITEEIAELRARVGTIFDRYRDRRKGEHFKKAYDLVGRSVAELEEALAVVRQMRELGGQGIGTGERPTLAAHWADEKRGTV